MAQTYMEERRENMDHFNLSGKIALITGASRGIGEAIAKLLAAHGAHIILTSRKLEGLLRVEGEIIQAGGTAESLVCHVGALPQIEELFSQVENRHGRLDILINNAGANPFFGDVLSADEKVWDKTCDVNLKGCFFMSQHAAKLMKKAGTGTIVNVASVNGDPTCSVSVNLLYYQSGHNCHNPVFCQGACLLRHSRKCASAWINGHQVRLHTNAKSGYIEDSPPLNTHGTYR
jgi:NAD(P)-dependent dehydrogenase (short-subunit alcohol dehydrogenase family)